MEFYKLTSNLYYYAVQSLNELATKFETTVDAQTPLIILISNFGAGYVSASESLLLFYYYLCFNC